MDWQQIIVIALSSGVTVKILDFLLSRVQEKKGRKVEKIRIVEEYLDELTGLVELYNFYARAELDFIQN